MPSTTFKNLPAEKREKLMKKFYEEFSENSYKEASISKIVAELEIAKGSIYKYFENKEDLYIYLIEQASQKKLNYIEKQLRSQTNRHEDLLWVIIQIGSDFDINNPIATRFLNRVFSDTHKGTDRDIKEDIKMQSYNYIMGIVEEGRGSGYLRTDIDAQTISHYINTILTHTGLLLAAKHGRDLEDFLDDARSQYAADSDHNELKKELWDIYNLLISGIKKQ